MSDSKEHTMPAGYIRLTDWREREAGKELPTIVSADQWEAMPLVSTESLIDGTHSESKMLPGIILQKSGYLDVGITFSVEGALTIAKFFQEYSIAVLVDGTEDEIRELQHGAGDELFSAAYEQMKSIVTRDMSLQCDVLKQQAEIQGRADGLKHAEALIQELGKAATCQDDEERDLILESLLPKLEAGLNEV